MFYQFVNILLNHKQNWKIHKIKFLNSVFMLYKNTFCVLNLVICRYFIWGIVVVVIWKILIDNWILKKVQREHFILCALFFVLCSTCCYQIISINLCVFFYSNSLFYCQRLKYKSVRLIVLIALLNKIWARNSFKVELWSKIRCCLVRSNCNSICCKIE